MGAHHDHGLAGGLACEFRRKAHRHPVVVIAKDTVVRINADSALGACEEPQDLPAGYVELAQHAEALVQHGDV